MYFNLFAGCILMYRDIDIHENKNWFLYKLGGLCLLVLSFIVFLSFMGHYSANLGWYHYSKNNVQYYLSTFAMYLSDLTMVYCGPLATISLAFVLTWWSVTMIIYSKPIVLKQLWNLTWLMVFASAFGTSFQIILTWHFPLGWGGHCGDFAYDVIMWVRDIMGLSHLFAWETGLLGLISLILLHKSLDLDNRHLEDLRHWILDKINIGINSTLFIIYSTMIVVKNISNGMIFTYNSCKQFLGLFKRSNADNKYISNDDAKLLLNDNSSNNNTAKQVDCNYRNEDFVKPSIDLLDAQYDETYEIDDYEINKICNLLKQALYDFDIIGEIVNVSVGPVISLFGFKPGPGIKISKIESLERDIARMLSMASVRIGIVEGSDTIGIEIPNKKRETIHVRSLYSNKLFSSQSPPLTLALGKKINGEPMFVDLSKMPHLLIAGTTGSGKSVAINTMLMSLLYRLSPNECQLILIDPKQLELSVYDNIPHLLMPVITNADKAVLSLKWAIEEMEKRYTKMSSMGVKNIVNYNELAKKRGTQVQVGYDAINNKPIYKNFSENLNMMPYIVIIIDELADLMMTASKEIDSSIQRLAQMARAAGIHLIVATQRPSVDVITGTIKANFPIRISFQVSSGFDSKTILGEQGAEMLLGNGDMLLMQGMGRLTRIHGCFISDMEVERIVSFLRDQGRPKYDFDPAQQSKSTPENQDFDDEIYDQVVDLVVSRQKCSINFIQKNFQIGYNCATKIIAKMENQGIISPVDRIGRRKILSIAASNVQDK